MPQRTTRLIGRICTRNYITFTCRLPPQSRSHLPRPSLATPPPSLPHPLGRLEPSRAWRRMVPPRRKLSAILGTPVAVRHSSRLVAFVTCVIFPGCSALHRRSLAHRKPRSSPFTDPHGKRSRFSDVCSCLRRLILVCGDN